METYLLLRSNKQSGPFTLEQLVGFGLKPYDLVWVEGKSAAWRYPSEVEGLKNYAPATEEQPFDRFYKKSEEKQEKTVPVEKHEPMPVNSVQQKTIASNKVFVSMPEGSISRKPAYAASSTGSVPQAKPMEKEIRTEQKKVESKPAYITEETNEPIIADKKNVKEEPVLSEKYSESLEDIKKRYTETYLNRKKRSGWTSTHTSIAQVFGGALFFCLLVVMVYRNFSGEESSQLTRTTVIQPDKKDINNTKQATTIPTTPENNKQTNKLKETKQQQPVKNEVNPPDESIGPAPVLQKKQDSNDYAILIANTMEKKAELPKPEEVKDVKEVKPKVRPVNINKLVNVKANNYKQRAFGGVMNLELTVNNDSKFQLDRVIVELQYLKPSEQPIKTERIVFNSVAAGDSKTLKIPDYARGVKIAYRVLDIESSQYDRQTAGL